jgi:putative sigma-54 modulation protein
MRLDFTGRQLEITTDLREYTQKHLSKVTRVLRDRFEVHAILTAEKHRRIAELTLKCRDHVLVGIEETADILTSINGAIGKLERQAVRLMERRRTRKRRPKQATAILLNVLRPERLDHEDHRLLERERIAIKPMTVEEAIDALDGTRAGIVVFRNHETERVNVIYLRHDGNLALIEPEP